MKAWKWKLLVPIILISLLVGAKYILWDFPISTGKRVGNLTKISEKGKIIPTWEGTIDEGSGDKLTTNFSVRDDKIGKELYNYEGRQVIIYYDQYILGWPRDTNYSVTSWKPKATIDVGGETIQLNSSGGALELLSETMFCALLGSLYADQELYGRVKDHLKQNNLYLYKNIEKCNK